MKIIIALTLVVAVAVAAPPPQNSQDAVILKYENDNIGVGGYKFAFETSDGVSRTETGEIRNPGTDNESLAVRGTISWVTADGTPYTLDFIADENGFQPTGAHIPRK